MTWYQVGIVSKEMPEIRWRTNVFPRITAALTGQVGSMAHTRQLLRVWSLVKSVIITGITGTGTGTGTGQTTAATGVTILESETVELSSSMSYKSRLVAIFVIVVTPVVQVFCFVWFFECVSQQSVIKQSSS